MTCMIHMEADPKLIVMSGIFLLLTVWSEIILWSISCFKKKLSKFVLGTSNFLLARTI